MNLAGKTLTLLLWAKDEGGEDSVTAHRGTLRASASGALEWYNNRNAKLEIDEEWLPRIRPVTEDYKELAFNADFMLSLKVGNLSDEDALGNLHTGLSINTDTWT